MLLVQELDQLDLLIANNVAKDRKEVKLIFIIINLSGNGVKTAGDNLIVSVYLYCFPVCVYLTGWRGTVSGICQTS